MYSGIKDVFGVEPILSESMAAHLDLCRKMYLNQSPWIKNEVKGLKIPFQVCVEFGRLICSEMQEEITGSSRAVYIEEQAKRLRKKLQQAVTLASGAGGMVMKPYVDDQCRIITDCVAAWDYYPVKIIADELRGAVFPEFLQKGKYTYVRLEYHDLTGTTYTIRNRAFKSRKMQVTQKDILQLGEEVDLSTVPEWQNVSEETVFDGADSMLFGVYRVPMANNIDLTSAAGLPVFSNAIDQIRKADEHDAKQNWEFDSKETAVQASAEYFKVNSETHKRETPKGKERLYTQMGESGYDGKPIFNVYSPDIRYDAFSRQQEDNKREIEFNCQLAYGTLSKAQEIEKTATEIMASKQRSYSAVTAMQGTLDDGMNEWIHAMDVLCDIYGLAPSGTVETNRIWGDSIMADEDAERANDRSDMAAGIMRPEEYRSKWYGESLDEARRNLPQQVELEI